MIRTSFLDSLPFWSWSFHSSTVWQLMTCPSSDEPAILSIIILIFSENFVSYNLRISIYITEPFSCYDITTLYKQHGGPYREKGLAFLTFYKFAINHDLPADVLISCIFFYGCMWINLKISLEYWFKNLEH